MKEKLIEALRALQQRDKDNGGTGLTWSLAETLHDEFRLPYLWSFFLVDGDQDVGEWNRFDDARRAEIVRLLALAESGALNNHDEVI